MDAEPNNLGLSGRATVKARPQTLNPNGPIGFRVQEGLGAAPEGALGMECRNCVLNLVWGLGLGFRFQGLSHELECLGSYE